MFLSLCGGEETPELTGTVDKGGTTTAGESIGIDDESTDDTRYANVIWVGIPVM